jgi:AcrR family transcriptional regulator
MEIPMQLRTDARLNHDRIVAAATEAFAERGLSVEMKEIADRAGVAVGTIYRHFPSKEELLAAICRSLLAEAVVETEAASAIANPIDALTVLLAGNLRRAARFGSLIGALVGGDLPRHHFEQIRAEALPRMKQRMRVIVQRAIDEGYLRRDLDPGIAAAMIEGTGLPWSYSSYAEGRDPEFLAGLIIKTFLEGAAPRELPADTNSADAQTAKD